MRKFLLETMGKEECGRERHRQRSDDLSQYFSECTGQEALGGRDMELVEEMGGDF